jgi:hypothetical protein
MDGFPFGRAVVFAAMAEVSPKYYSQKSHRNNLYYNNIYRNNFIEQAVSYRLMDRRR